MNINGTSGNDTLNGTTGNDSILAFGGDDFINAGAGNDTIEYGAGNDTVFGGDGDDLIDDQGGIGGFNGNNLIFGGAGNETVFDSSGNDTVFGEAGNDLLLMDSGGNDSVEGGDGNDTIEGGTGNDTLIGGAGSDNLVGGDGADFFLLDQTTGFDTVSGGAGGTDLDRLSLATNSAGNGITITLTGNEAGTVTVNGGAQIASFTDIEQFILTGSNDAFNGADSLTAAVTVDGGAGNDFVIGTGVADSLIGGLGNDSVYGGQGADTLSGGDGIDSIFGGAGNDSISGDAGSDTIEYGAGNDTVFGGDGDDFIDDQGGGGFQNGDNQLFGGGGNDTIWDSAGNDTVSGGDGNDFLGMDSGGNDSVDGGAGNDTLLGGTGNDTLLGGAGADSLDGGDGADVFVLDQTTGLDTVAGGAGGTDLDRIDLSANAAANGVTVALTANEGGTVTVNGGAQIASFTDIERFTLTANNDTLSGADSITAGVNVDGGAGSDSLRGTGGTDTLLGGTGNDTLDGGAANDSLDGGDGVDVLVLDQTTGLDTVSGGAGGTDFDRIDLSANAAANGVSVALTANEAGTIAVNGGAQIASFTEIEQITLTASSDTLTGADSITAGVNVDGAAGNDSLRGTGGTDTLLGGTGNDTLDGRAGNDSLLGGDGSDRLVGGTGSDTLDGGAGDDVIEVGGTDVAFGGAGDDLFLLDIADIGISDSVTVVGGETGEDLTDPTNGGAGDILDLSLSLDPVTVTFGADAESGTVNGIDVDAGSDITFSQIERVVTTDLDDTIFGGSTTGAINVDLGGGNDVVTTGSGSDTITGGAGDDVVSSGAGNDTVLGGDGNDTLSGGDGSDSLSGGTGDDVITAGAGNDTLGGGAGQDRFVFENGGGTDRIIDFNLTRINGFATDRLDVSGLTDAGGNPVNWQDVVVSDTVGDGSGDAVLTFPNGQTIILAGISPAAVTGQPNLVALGIPCFASGTPVRTPQGWRPVETLEKGDLVYTLDHGLQPIVWCGARQTTREEMEEKPMLLPVKVRAGALGNGRDIRLSAQHAILMRLGGQEVLVRAIHLARFGFRGVRIAQGTRQVCYHHLLLPNHGIIESDGLLSESFYPGPMALSMLSPGQRLEMAAAICRVRPQRQGDRVLALNEIYGPTARRVLTGKEAGAAICQNALRPIAMQDDWPLAVQGRPISHLRLVKGF